MSHIEVGASAHMNQSQYNVSRLTDELKKAISRCWYGNGIKVLKPITKC